MRLESYDVTLEQATETYFELKKNLGEEIQALDNMLHINGRGSKLHDLAEMETANYLTTRYVKGKINTAAEALTSA